MMVYREPRYRNLNALNPHFNQYSQFSSAPGCICDDEGQEGHPQSLERRAGAFSGGEEEEEKPLGLPQAGTADRRHLNIMDVLPLCSPAH